MHFSIDRTVHTTAFDKPVVKSSRYLHLSRRGALFIEYNDIEINAYCYLVNTSSNVLRYTQNNQCSGRFTEPFQNP